MTHLAAAFRAARGQGAAEALPQRQHVEQDPQIEEMRRDPVWVMLAPGHPSHALAAAAGAPEARGLAQRTFLVLWGSSTAVRCRVLGGHKLRDQRTPARLQAVPGGWRPTLFIWTPNFSSM